MSHWLEYILYEKWTPEAPSGAHTRRYLDKRNDPVVSKEISKKWKFWDIIILFRKKGE